MIVNNVAGMEEARVSVASIIKRCEKAQVKFNKGSPQYTLLDNRLKAMYLAKSLLSADEVLYTLEEVRDSLPPINSIIHKCEKALSNAVKGSSTSTRLHVMIRSMKSVKRLLESYISK